MLYKDLPIVNQRTDEAMKKVLSEIARLLQTLDEKALRDELLQTNEQKIKELDLHEPDHDGCSSIKKNDLKINEKRICRCMSYYNQESKKCQNCYIVQKWMNVGKIKITDYEWPTDHVFKNVGGMDLILDNLYAAEVKPIDSSETLTRMIAEALTYTADCSLNYRPAICFFKGSSQENDFNKYKNSKDLLYILKFVKVFKIIYKEKSGICEFEILPVTV